jgi:hypothetical protein
MTMTDLPRTTMAYNADMVSRVTVSAPRIMTVFCTVSSRSLTAMPSEVAIQLMRSVCFSMQRREQVCPQEILLFSYD